MSTGLHRARSVSTARVTSLLPFVAPKTRFGAAGGKSIAVTDPPRIFSGERISRRLSTSHTRKCPSDPPVARRCRRPSALLNFTHVTRSPPVIGSSYRTNQYPSKDGIDKWIKNQTDRDKDRGPFGSLLHLSSGKFLFVLLLLLSLEGNRGLHLLVSVLFHRRKSLCCVSPQQPIHRTHSHPTPPVKTSSVQDAAGYPSSQNSAIQTGKESTPTHEEEK